MQGLGETLHVHVECVTAYVVIINHQGVEVCSTPHRLVFWEVVLVVAQLVDSLGLAEELLLEEAYLETVPEVCLVTRVEVLVQLVEVGCSDRTLKLKLEDSLIQEVLGEEVQGEACFKPLHLRVGVR